VLQPPTDGGKGRVQASTASGNGGQSVGGGGSGAGQADVNTGFSEAQVAPVPMAVLTLNMTCPRSTFPTRNLSNTASGATNSPHHRPHQRFWRAAPIRPPNTAGAVNTCTVTHPHQRPLFHIPGTTIQQSGMGTGADGSKRQTSTPS